MLKFIEYSFWIIAAVVIAVCIMIAATGCIPAQEAGKLLLPWSATVTEEPLPQPEPPVQTLIIAGLSALGLGGIAAWVRKVRIVVSTNTNKIAEHDGKLSK